jgi:hypothetical protein
VNYLDASPNAMRVIRSKRIRWTGHIRRMGEMGMHAILVGKQENRRLRRPRPRWEDNIRMK